MSAATKHPNEAWELLKFLAGPEGNNTWLELYDNRSIPPLKELAQSDTWLNYAGPEHRDDTQNFLDQLDSTRPPTNFGNANAAENAWNEEFELVMTEQQTVEQAVTNICDKLSSILQQP